MLISALIIVGVIIFMFFYIANHQSTVESLKSCKKYNDTLYKENIEKDKIIHELKKFPKPSDPSRLDAALSEIRDLKSRLKIAEATAHDATEKAKLSNNIREERKFYLDKYRELTEENRKLKEEIKTVKQSKPRPQHVYSSLEVEDQVLKYKNQLYKKEEEIKSLKYKLSDANLRIEQTQEDLQDLFDTVDDLNEEIRSLKYDSRPSDEYTSIIKESIPRVAALPFAEIPSDFEESIASGRLNNAFKSHLMIIDRINMEAKIKSDKDTYKTTLHSCTCPDFTYRHNVCKHMLFLSYTSGLLLLNKEVAGQIAQK